MTPGTWVVIALVAAFLAIAVSGLGRGGRGFRQFLADLRFWGRRRPDPTGIGTAPETWPRLIAVPIEEGGIDDLFDIGDRPEHAYLEPFLGLILWVARRPLRADAPLTASPAMDTPSTPTPTMDTPSTASQVVDTAA